MSFRNYLRVPLAMAVLALPGLAQETGAPAQPANPTTTKLYFPPVSLANGETAQLNVAAIATNDSSTGSCTGSILITNPAGPVSDPLPFNVSVGQIFSSSYPNSSGSRISILAAVLENGFLPATAASARCSFSLELIGPNSHTVLANPAPLVGLMLVLR